MKHALTHLRNFPDVQQDTDDDWWNAEVKGTVLINIWKLLVENNSHMGHKYIHNYLLSLLVHLQTR